MTPEQATLVHYRLARAREARLLLDGGHRNTSVNRLNFYAVSAPVLAKLARVAPTLSPQQFLAAVKAPSKSAGTASPA